MELLVVIAIMGLMLTLSAGVLRNGGKGKSVDSAVMQLESLIREARMTAIGNDTCTRVVIVDDENERRGAARHLRFMTVMQLLKSESRRGTYDGTSVDHRGRWVSVIAGVMIPAEVYFSPYYSGVLRWSKGSGGSATMLGRDSVHLSGRGTTRVYYIEFDEKGRFVEPEADVRTPSRPLRLVFINGQLSKDSKAHDGIKAKNIDKQGRPLGAKGIVLWPGGDTSRLRTVDQLESGSSDARTRNNKRASRKAREESDEEEL